LRDVLVSIATHYRAGTPNGIHMDRESGLIFSPPHFTWMDTNFPAATPRMGYPIEIQALWIACLHLLGRHVDPVWSEFALHARQSLQRLFWIAPDSNRPKGRRVPGRKPHGDAPPDTGGWLADCLRGEPGLPAAQAVVEDALRPNQLLAITLGAVTARDRTIPILDACARLLVPGGIRSLADQPVRTELPVWRDGQLLNDPQRPYWGRYAGDEDTRRKPAYHNGTAWTWQFPLYAEAYARVYGKAAHATARALLGSATEVLNRGCLGQMPEILDGDAPHALRGCCAQAWGVSELLRVWRLLD
jgi:glycogen debranching enzyme